LNLEFRIAVRVSEWSGNKPPCKNVRRHEASRESPGQIPCGAARWCGQNVIGQFEFFGGRLPVGCAFVAISLRCLAFRNGRLLHFLAVLIETRQKKNLLSQAPSRTRNPVGDDFFVCMAEMRLAIDKINRGCDVKALVVP
jgi:hypothetical protein